MKTITLRGKTVGFVCDEFAERVKGLLSEKQVVDGQQVEIHANCKPLTSAYGQTQIIKKPNGIALLNISLTVDYDKCSAEQLLALATRQAKTDLLNGCRDNAKDKQDAIEKKAIKRSTYNAENKANGFVSLDASLIGKNGSIGERKQKAVDNKAVDVAKLADNGQLTAEQLQALIASTTAALARLQQSQS